MMHKDLKIPTDEEFITYCVLNFIYDEKVIVDLLEGYRKDDPIAKLGWGNCVFCKERTINQIIVIPSNNVYDGSICKDYGFYWFTFCTEVCMNCWILKSTF